MAQQQSDNIIPYHPKPVIEGYLKYLPITDTYADYADTADVIASVPIEFRVNKTFRIAGVDMFTSDGTNFFSPNIRNMSDFFQVLNP